MRPTACHILAAVFALLTGLLGAPGTAVAQIASTYTVTDLGNFYATGVNDSSWVSGYDTRALVWRPGLGTQQIRGPFDCTAGCTTRANAINNVGEVAGYVWYTNFSSHRAIRWSESGGVVDMGDLPGGGNYSYGYAINAQGWVAGQASGQYSQHPNFGNQSYQHATRFRSPTNIVELQDLPPGTQNSNGRGINDAGAVVGERNTSTGRRAVYWAPDGTALDLAAEWDGGGGQSFASDINNLGQVAMQLPLATGGNTAAVWQDGVGFTEIGLLPGTSTAIANAINDEGVTVGTAGTAFSKGFAWSLADGVVDLNDRLDPVSGDGWSILQATGISESGLIVGRGYSSTLGYRAVLMTPVSVTEPPTADAGLDQSIRAGDTVMLDGSQSFDDDTAATALGYSWTFWSFPGVTPPTLNGADTAAPTFLADVAGTYVLDLVVTDEEGLSSAADQVTISSTNLAPTAVATVDYGLAIVGTNSNFDGSSSVDPEDDELTFSWTITSRPVGSTAILVGDDTATPSLTTDAEGIYEVTLTVSDFLGEGTPATVEIVATTAQNYAEIKIVEAFDAIDSLNSNQVTTLGNQKALGNFLKQATRDIQKGSISNAIGKLNQTLERTDGCALRGIPDGNGDGMDWITDCDAQMEIYLLLIQAIDALDN